MPRSVSVKIEGLDEVLKKLDYPILVDPAVQEAQTTIGDRVMRGGKGLGARRNLLTRAPLPQGFQVISTRRSPRQRGTAWIRKNLSIVRAMMPRVLNKAIAKIESRWSA